MQEAVQYGSSPDLNQPTSPSTDLVLTDGNIGPLIELTDDKPLGW